MASRIKGITVEIGGDTKGPERRQFHNQDHAVFPERREQAPETRSGQYEPRHPEAEAS